MTERVLRAGVWTFAFRSVARGLGFIRNIVLARILAPDDIGLFGIVLVILSILDRFTETGFHGALVQKKGEIGRYLDSTWTVLALRRVALAGVLVAMAPLMASLFDEPRATPLIRLLGLSVLIQAFANVATVEFQRELEMKRQFISGFSGTVADLLVSVALAIHLQSAWALMYGLVARRIVSVAVSYAVHPYRPRPRLDWMQTRELGRFGRWEFAKKLLTFLTDRGDSLLVGMVLGAPALGVYMLAYSISEAVTVEIARVLNNVAFPAYARKQADLARIREGFLMASELVAASSIPVAVGMSIVAEPLTLVLLGEGWIGVAAILPPLAAAGCVRAIVANGSAVSKGLGHPRHGFERAAVQIVVMYSVVFPLMSTYGLVGLGYAVLLGALAPVPLFVRNSASLLGIGGGALLRTLAPAALLGAVTAVVLLATAGAGEPPSLSGLLARTALAGLVAIAVSAWLWRRYQVGPLRIPLLLHARRASLRGSLV